MAFDALRMRNIIQLVGILGMPSLNLLHYRPQAPNFSAVFHLALMVGAALQVHQTRSALVTRGECDGSVNFSVSNYLVFLMKHSLIFVQNCGGPGSLWRLVEPFLIVAPCIIAASWLAMVFWIRQLYSEFGLVTLSFIMLPLFTKLVGRSSMLLELIPK